MNSINQSTKIAKLIASVWHDENIKSKLHSDPIAVLKEFGISVPSGIVVKVLEDTETKVHLVLPVKPADIENADVDLNKLTWAYESNSGPSGGSSRGQ